MTPRTASSRRRSSVRRGYRERQYSERGGCLVKRNGDSRRSKRRCEAIQRRLGGVTTADVLEYLQHYSLDPESSSARWGIFGKESDSAVDIVCSHGTSSKW